MVKSPQMEAFLEQAGQDMFGRSRKECKAKGLCVVCGGDATHFDDLISRSEYEISVMCQSCQDDTFSA